MNKFSLESYRLMDPFWERLQKVLENLPGNPKPTCEGFFFAWYSFPLKRMIVEQIGIVPSDKKFKYLHFATKKVTQTLLFGKTRSKEFENNDLEQYPGGIKLYDGCAGTSGHESMVDEAISTLFLIAEYFTTRYSPRFIEQKEFWVKLNDFAQENQKMHAPDNKWIGIIAELMEQNS